MIGKLPRIGTMDRAGASKTLHTGTYTRAMATSTQTRYEADVEDVKMANLSYIGTRYERIWQ